MKPIEHEGKFYRVRRGKLVEIPARWLGKVTSHQQIHARPSKMIQKHRKAAKHDRPNRRMLRESAEAEDFEHLADAVTKRCA